VLRCVWPLILVLVPGHSITPRQAQRQRELAASPTQLSPASPVTEDESSAVLQRVNKAVSEVHWDEQAQTAGEARPELPAAGLRTKTLAGERDAVFNTPLRVNKFVSEVHWDELAQTPGHARPENPASGLRTEELAGEREAVFNTPLPPGTRAAVRRAPQEVRCCSCASTDASVPKPVPAFCSAAPRSTWRGRANIDPIAVAGGQRNFDGTTSSA